jgi:hypothetical protein
MKLIGELLLIFCILSAVGLNAAEEQLKNKEKYFEAEDYPMVWQAILPLGETALTAKTDKYNVRVIITAKRETTKKQQNNRPTLNKMSCKYDYCIDIIVNDSQIIVPNSVYCDLVELNRGKVFIEGQQMFLLADGGDAISYYVKIDFDRERVIRRTRYSSSAMLSSDVTQITNYSTSNH